MSNKITVVAGARTIQARLRPWGDVKVDDVPELLYFRAHKWNGHVGVKEEGRLWIRGWNHARERRNALVVAAALSR